MALIEGSISCEMYYDSGSVEALAKLMQDNPHKLKVFSTRKVWKFPEEKFCAYEPSDEWWCRILGIGEEVESEESWIFPSIKITELTENGFTFTSLPSPFESTGVSNEMLGLHL